MSVDIREAPTGQRPASSASGASRSSARARPSGRRARSAAATSAPMRGEVHADHRRQRLGQEHAGQGDLGRPIPSIPARCRSSESRPPRPRKRAPLGIAHVFQEVLVADECSVLDNLYLGADGLFSKSCSHAEKLAHVAGADAGAARASISICRRRSAVFRSASSNGSPSAARFLTDPKVLILDESSAALDFDSTERLFAKMRQFRDEGVAIIIVTHRIAELVRIADRATVLRDGIDVGVLTRRGDHREEPAATDDRQVRGAEGFRRSRGSRATTAMSSCKPRDRGSGRAARTSTSRSARAKSSA